MADKTRTEVLHRLCTLKSTYYRKYGNASVLLTITVQRAKFIISRSKNMLTWRKDDRMSIVYLKFLWRNYHCCPIRGCIAYNVFRFV